MRLLVVQANSDGEALEQAFIEQSYQVTLVRSGCDALECVEAEEFDSIILARQLPDMDGVDVCRRMRQNGVATPLIVLAHADGTDATVEALDAGADHYVAKPVEFEEIAARVRSVLRRHEPEEGSILRYEGIALDLVNRSVTVNEETVVLTRREFALLEYLMRHRDRVVSRTSLGEHVWGLDYGVENSNVVDVYVSRLRKKISNGKQFIHTVHGTGYMLSANAPAAL